MKDDDKVLFLFKLVGPSYLRKSIQALKYQMVTDPSGTVSYTTAEIFLIAAFSELTEYVSRNRGFSSVNVRSGDLEGAYKSGRTINNGYIPNYRSLSN